MILLTVFLVAGTTAFAWLSGGTSLNYTDPDGPLYTGAFATGVPAAEADAQKGWFSGIWPPAMSPALPTGASEPIAVAPESAVAGSPNASSPAPAAEPAADGRIVVVTYNLQYGEEVEAAVAEFKAHPELLAADALFLQEVDHPATAAMAEALGYDYVYYPASIHPKTGRDMGNAVLSRGRLTEPEKILLPHLSPHNGQLRIATGATTTVEGEELTLYSVHLETQLLSIDERVGQAEAVVAELPSSGAVIVAGDLNTAPGGELEELKGAFDQADLARVSAGAGDTWSLAFLDAALDHVFARGFEVVAVGTVDGTTSSDHRPLWVELRPR